MSRTMICVSNRLNPLWIALGSIWMIRDGISPLTDERETLHGLRVEIVGKGGMSGSVRARIVGSVEEIVETLSSRDAWWTIERVEELLLCGEVEFEGEQLVRA